MNFVLKMIGKNDSFRTKNRCELAPVGGSSRRFDLIVDPIQSCLVPVRASAYASSVPSVIGGEGFVRGGSSVRSRPIHTYIHVHRGGLVFPGPRIDVPYCVRTESLTGSREHPVITLVNEITVLPACSLTLARIGIFCRFLGAGRGFMAAFRVQSSNIHVDGMLPPETT